MAVVGLRHIYLYDKWPGTPNFNLNQPTNGFDSTVTGSGNAVSTALYPPGTKIARMYTSTDQSEWPGESIFAYLRYYEGTDTAFDAGEVSLGYGVCAHADLTTTADGSIAGWFVVTNDLTNSDATQGGALAIPCVDLSTGDYGWFWVGGVCPVSDVTRLNTDIRTGGSVAENSFVLLQDDATFGSAFEVCDGSNNQAIGKSLQVDA